MTAFGYGWSLTYLLHSTILIVAVWLASRWVRSASTRDTLWKIALIGALFTATIQVAGTFDRVLPRRARARMAVTVPGAVSAAPAVEHSAPATVDRPHDGSTPRRTVPILPLAWAGIAAFLLARVVRGRSRFLAAMHPRVEVLDGDERELLDALAAAMGVDRPLRLTASDGVGSPVAMLGWEIVISPAVFARLTAQQRETILAHELAHLVRRDPLWLTVAEVLKAVLFFQPLHWLVGAKMKETAEFLCDDAAVRQTGNRKALAESLAQLARSLAPPAPAVAAMAEGGSQLIARVRRVLRPGEPDAPLPAHTRLVLALSVIALTAAFAPSMALMPSIGEAVSRAAVDRPDESHFADGELSRTFTGPYGTTHVHFAAHHATLANDGSFVGFDSADGFVRATETSDSGPRRDVEITPGRRLEPIYHYAVNGVAREWSSEAELIIASAFGSTAAPRSSFETSRRDDMKTWNATVEMSGERDGAPTHVRIEAVGIHYDAAGRISMEPRSSLHVEEQVGNRKITFDMTPGQTKFHSDGWGATSMQDEAQWLRGQLRRNTTLPDNAIRSLTTF